MTRPRMYHIQVDHFKERLFLALKEQFINKNIYLAGKNVIITIITIYQKHCFLELFAIVQKKRKKQFIYFSSLYILD